MTQPEIPAELLDGVIRQFDPIEVWLFGSQATGQADAQSDIDLYVVVDDEGAEDKLSARAIAKARRDYRKPVDIFVARRSTFDDRRDRIGAMAHVVAETGLVIYRRAA